MTERDLDRCVQAHRARLTHRAARLLGPRRPRGLRPSDLVQDTVERALRSLASFRGTTDEELRGWLGVILRNTAIAHRRAAARRKRGQEAPLPREDLLPAAQLSPSQLLQGRESLRDLLAALFELPEAQQQVLRRYLRGAEVAEIARELGRTPASVSCLLQRGAQALRQRLGAEQGGRPWLQELRRLLSG